MITTVKYLDSSSNLTIPDPYKQVRSTGSITFPASGISGNTGKDIHGGDGLFYLAHINNIARKIKKKIVALSNQECYHTFFARVGSFFSMIWLRYAEKTTSELKVK